MISFVHDQHASVEDRPASRCGYTVPGITRVSRTRDRTSPGRVVRRATRTRGTFDAKSVRFRSRRYSTSTFRRSGVARDNGSDVSLNVRASGPVVHSAASRALSQMGGSMLPRCQIALAVALVLGGWACSGGTREAEKAAEQVTEGAKGMAEGATEMARGIEALGKGLAELTEKGDSRTRRAGQFQGAAGASSRPRRLAEREADRRTNDQPDVFLTGRRALHEGPLHDRSPRSWTRGSTRC